MSGVFTAAGTVLAVSSTLPATFDLSGYAALAANWKDVGEVTAIPSHGPAYALVTHTPLATRIVTKRKGSVNYGSFTLPLALVPSDEGQLVCRDHADGTAVDDSVAVRITKPEGSIRYTTAQVMSFQEAADGTDSISAASIMLELDRPVLYDDATS